jgi:hypothetical protein
VIENTLELAFCCSVRTWWKIAPSGRDGQIDENSAQPPAVASFSSSLTTRTSVAKDSTKTTIEADGLRYRSKAPGSPFAATSSFGAATMSCFLCGKHRPRAMLKSKKLLGKSQPVCAPSCKELDEQLSKA